MKKLLLCVVLLYCFFLSGCAFIAMGMSASTQTQVDAIREKIIAKDRGVVFDMSSSVVKVKSIRPQSDADKAGLQVGDEIISINNKDKTSPKDIIDLFFSSENEPISMSIKRKDLTLSAVLMPL
jgi:Periplasmic protease